MTEVQEVMADVAMLGADPMLFLKARALLESASTSNNAEALLLLESFKVVQKVVKHFS